MSQPLAPPAADPVLACERLREAKQFWKTSTLGLGSLLAVIFAISFVQFLGTLKALELAQQSKQETESVKADAEFLLDRCQANLQRLRQHEADFAQRVAQLEALAGTQKAVDATAARLGTLQEQVDDIKEQRAAEARRRAAAIARGQGAEGLIWINGVAHSLDSAGGGDGMIWIGGKPFRLERLPRETVPDAASVP
jgi:hypothetical protein